MDLETARSVLLEHARSRRNGVFPENATHEGRLVNPACGDQVELRARHEDGRIAAIGFGAKACAICTASASLLCEEAAGRAPAEILSLGRDFSAALTAGRDEAWPARLAGLAGFEHLKVNPSRRACALLPWLALAQILP